MSRRCSRRRTRTARRSCPWGGGSGTQGGSLPIHGGIVLDLRSLDRVLEIDENSLTVTAQAGVNGRRLEAELNARGLMLPHYPASVEWATVGGYIAARGSGVLSTRYGKIEDLLLTLRVATPATGLIQTVGVSPARGGARADAAVRRLRGHAGRDHERDAPAGADAPRAPLRRGRIPVRQRRDPRHPEGAAGRPPPVGRAHVRRGRDAAHVRPRRRRGSQRRLHRPRLRGRERRCGGGGAAGRSRSPQRPAASCWIPLSASAGGTGATTSTTLLTSPSCPPSGARSTSSRPTRGSRRSTTRSTRRCASPTRTWVSSCACTSRTGTRGAR